MLLLHVDQIKCKNVFEEGCKVKLEIFILNFKTQENLLSDTPIYYHTEFYYFGNNF